MKYIVLTAKSTFDLEKVLINISNLGGFQREVSLFKGNIIIKQ